jgi:hypothetical protein
MPGGAHRPRQVLTATAVKEKPGQTDLTRQVSRHRPGWVHRNVRFALCREKTRPGANAAHRTGLSACAMRDNPG